MLTKFDWSVVFAIGMTLAFGYVGDVCDESIANWSLVVASEMIGGWCGLRRTGVG